MIRTIDQLVALLPEWKAARKKVVWTNGCFDILHAGHARSLADAKALGDILVVGVNSDRTVRLLKGESRPWIGEQDRAELVAALKPVDYVVIFDQPDPVAILARLKPDIHCKGAEYASGARPMPECDTVLSYGGEVRFLPFHEGRSTTSIAEAIIEKALSPK